MKKSYLMFAIIGLLMTVVAGKSGKKKGTEEEEGEKKTGYPEPKVRDTPLIVAGRDGNPGYSMYGPTFSIGGTDYYVIKPPEQVYDDSMALPQYQFQSRSSSSFSTRKKRDLKKLLNPGLHPSYPPALRLPYPDPYPPLPSSYPRINYARPFYTAQPQYPYPRPHYPSYPRIPNLPYPPPSYRAPPVYSYPNAPRYPKANSQYPNYPNSPEQAQAPPPAPKIPQPQVPETPIAPEIPTLPPYMLNHQAPELPEMPTMPMYPELPTMPIELYENSYPGKVIHSGGNSDDPNFIVYLPSEPSSSSLENNEDNEDSDHHPYRILSSGDKGEEGHISVYEYDHYEPPQQQLQEQQNQEENNNYNILPISFPHLSLAPTPIPYEIPIQPLQPETPVTPLPIQQAPSSSQNSDSEYAANEMDGTSSNNDNQYDSNPASTDNNPPSIVPSYAKAPSLQEYKPVSSVQDIYAMSGSNPIMMKMDPYNYQNNSDGSSSSGSSDGKSNEQRASDEELFKNMDAYEEFLRQKELQNQTGTQHQDNFSSNSNNNNNNNNYNSESNNNYNNNNNNSNDNDNNNNYNNSYNQQSGAHESYENSASPSYIKTMTFDTPSSNTSYRIGVYSQSNGDGPSSAFATVGPKKILVYASTPKNPQQTTHNYNNDPTFYSPPPPSPVYYQPQPQQQHPLHLQIPMPLPPLNMMSPGQLMGPNGFNLGLLQGAGPGYGQTDGNVALVQLETTDGKDYEEEEEDRKMKMLRKT